MNFHLQKIRRPALSPPALQAGGSKGFTLVELMVAIAIMGLMLGFLIPGLRGYEQRNRLDRTAQNIRGTILETKNYALAPRSSATNNPEFYSIHFLPAIGSNPGKYQIFEGNNAVPNKLFTLPDGVSFGTLPTNIDFSIPEQGKIINQTEDVITVQIQDTNNNVRNIIINKETGQVEIK